MDGTKLCSRAVCKNLVWEMQGKTFVAELRLLPLGGCDMVLGIQWLSTLGPILWDFQNLSMQFQLQGKPLVLKGESQMKVEQVSPKQLEKTLQHTKQGFIPHLCSLTVERQDHW